MKKTPYSQSSNKNAHAHAGSSLKWQHTLRTSDGSSLWSKWIKTALTGVHKVVSNALRSMTHPSAEFQCCRAEIPTIQMKVFAVSRSNNFGSKHTILKSTQAIKQAPHNDLINNGSINNIYENMISWTILWTMVIKQCTDSERSLTILDFALN